MADQLTGATGSFLVIGGAGRTGRRVADRLVGRGHGVTVASRRPRRVPDRVTALTVDLAKGFDPALLTGLAGVVVSVEPPSDSAGADALLHQGVETLAIEAAKSDLPVVLVSSIYSTRAHEHPEFAGIIRARAAGEEALRHSGTPYTIVRPGWLTESAAVGVRLEQGDTGDGSASRDAVADAVVEALFSTAARGKTFELYDDPGAPALGWPTAFAGLDTDAR
ncbi:NAD(P)H-binding protein [Streptomyces sp. NBC_01136]|uniref:SDR family oxidoreductase n=1 Tax=unclassified Streptomyces TaxID=2593676 RepID=UPI0032467A67|nr:NAD(P)H-binding protein [Streptomyces sp. NBC_01136]